MTTRGYNRYRGRGGGKKTVWTVVLLVILLAAVGYLFSQRYLVYDESGKAHWELPFARHTEPGQTQPENNPVSPEDVVIDRQDPEPETEPEPQTPAKQKLQELHAQELENGSLWWDPAYVLTLVDESMVVEVKRASGGITFGTEVETAPGVVVERGVTRENLTTLLQSDRYAVARINCFWDTAGAEGRPEMALTAASGKVWYDGSGRAWLDPSNPAALAYLTALCQECAKLGFDEILLDGFCYPTTGDRNALQLAEGLNKTAALTDFAAALRKALPENVALSVTYRGEMGALDGPSGLTAALLATFDRIYVDQSVDREALDKALPAEFDRTGGLVLLCGAKPASGGYVILP